MGIANTMYTKGNDQANSFIDQNLKKSVT